MKSSLNLVIISIGCSGLTAFAEQHCSLSEKALIVPIKIEETPSSAVSPLIAYPSTGYRYKEQWFLLARYVSVIVLFSQPVEYGLFVPKHPLQPSFTTGTTDWVRSLHLFRW